MAEEENFDDVDISEMIEESENYLDTEHQNAETSDLENVSTLQDSEILNSEEQIADEKKPQIQNKSETIRSTRLAMARIKNIMKMDPDVSVVSGDAVFLVTKATVSILTKR